MSIDWSKKKTKQQYEQEELDLKTEVLFNEFQNKLKCLEIQFMGNTFSASQEQQNYVVAMLTKLANSQPSDTRNIFTIEGNKVLMTKKDLFNFMATVDLAQEALMNEV